MAKTRHYRAAGGIVLQQGLVKGLDPDVVYVLLLDRPSRDEVRLPKGHIDDGESARAAALRETTEETGYADLEILADLGHLVVEFDYQGEHYARDESFFLMRLCSERQVPRSQIDAQQFSIRWTRIDEADDHLTYQAERRWMRRARAAREDVGRLA